MYVKPVKQGFSNTLSGHLNSKNNQVSKKGLDLQDFDVQMLSPDFLCSKTLKKPFRQLPISLTKTNPNGTRSQIPAQLQYTSSAGFQNRSNATNRKHVEETKASEEEYNYVSCEALNIRPASRPSKNYKPQNSIPAMQLQFKDKNSIISALLKKGQLNSAANYQIKIIPAPQPAKKVGPAEAKLKNLFNKKTSIQKQEVTKKKTKELVVSDADIGQEINESIEEEYANESFEKISGAYESQIKESIRQSMSHAKGSIHQSIHESIKDEIPESFRSGVSKSKQSLKQQIAESLPKQNVEEEVYEEIFEEASLSDQLSKSKTKFKKQKEEDKFELSASASKKFRTKTNTITKSIKFAEQLVSQNQTKDLGSRFQQKYEKGDKLAEQLIKQKSSLSNLHKKISTMLESTSSKSRKGENRNLQLFHKFRIEINRLVTSQNFMSKLRRLTAFLGDTKNSKSEEQVSKLEDELLRNIMERIQDMRVSGVSQTQLTKMRKDYDQKLATLLKQQQMSLRVEMDRKLHEKDLQLKKMIAELEQKLNNSAPNFYKSREIPIKPSHDDRVEVDSDYSIDSDEISWKMDLWEVLPDYEKKKLYEKQGAEIAKFLTDALVNQIKNEGLDRSADISFEFPDEFNTSGSDYTENNNKPTFQKRTGDQGKRTIESQQKKQTKTVKSQIFPPLPGVKKASNMRQEHFENNIHYLQMPLGKVPENETRDTKPVSEVVKILAKYKNQFLKKKNDLIRKIIKTLQGKHKENELLSGLINDIRILNQIEVAQADQPFVKAYEEDIIMELVAIFNKNKNRKNNVIEEEMKKMYDRLLVTCQVKTAEASVKSPNEIVPNEVYIDLRIAQEDKKVKQQIVKQICNLLAAEFAKEMPKRK